MAQHRQAAGLPAHRRRPGAGAALCAEGPRPSGVRRSERGGRTRETAQKAQHCLRLAGRPGGALMVAGFFVWQFYALPLNSKAWIREIKETKSIETKTNNLAWLATFQPWMPPYDFSGTPQLA